MRYGVILVYSIGLGVPFLLYFVLRFMKCDTLKLPEVLVYVNIVDMHIRVFFRMLHPDILAVHNSLRLVALDSDDIRDDQFNSFHQLEFIGVVVDFGEEGFGGVWNSGGCSDLFVLDVQVGLFRFDLREEFMIVCLLYLPILILAPRICYIYRIGIVWKAVVNLGRVGWILGWDNIWEGL